MSKSILQKKKILTKAGGGSSLATPVTVPNGGTGISSYAIGDIIYASGATTLSKLPIGTASQQLRVNAGATALEYFTPAASGITVGSTVTSGTDTRVFYQDGTTFAQDADFTWNKTTNILNTTGGYTINTYSFFKAGGVTVGRGISLGYSGFSTQITPPDYSTLIGGGSGDNGMSGSAHTCLGYRTMRNGTGTETISIGAGANSNSAANNFNYTLFIGSSATSSGGMNNTASNQAVIGMPGGNGYTQFYFGQGVNAVSGTPSGVTFNATSGTTAGGAFTILSGAGSGADKPSGNLTLGGGQGTGSASTGGDIIFQTSDAPAASSSTLQTLTTKYTIKKNGVQDYPTTVTAGGTTGDQTINKVSGTVNFAAGATAITVTNSLVSTTSIVFAVVRTNDTTATIKNVVPGSGSFVITLTAAATAETSVGFFTINS